ncbi:MAG: hypothetical protein JXA21_05985 [Anaerolineae bacterium]|nr:hypothetical protein [Anaerolineae bacterium]
MLQKPILKCLTVCATLIALVLAVPQVARADGGIIYVDVNAGGTTHDGLSWITAYTTLQDALAVVNYGDEIWVAEGVYYPDLGAGQTEQSRTSTFTLRPGVAIYGGFDGTETDLTMRDPASHITVLSGDVDGNDVVNAYGVVTDAAKINFYNAYHVVTSINVTETTRLDGLTITAGKADTSAAPNNQGGGMFNDHGGPILFNVIFSGNYAEDYGAGMFNKTSTPTLTNVTFTGNRSYGDGGGMHNEASTLTLTNVTFTGNWTSFGGNGGGMANISSTLTATNINFNNNSSGYSGGGMSNEQSNLTLTHAIFDENRSTYGSGGMDNNDSNITLTDATFLNNLAYEDGGAIGNWFGTEITLTNATFSGNQAIESNGGGMSSYWSSVATLVNVVFQGNYARWGGGGIDSANSDLTLINVTFSGNHSPSSGGGINSHHDSYTMTNCILWGNTAGGSGPQIANYNSNSILDITYSLIQGNTYTGTGNLSLDPHFVAPVTGTVAPTTTGDYRLTGISPAIDAGDPASCPETDLRGQPRDDLRCDMGAYEYTLADGDTVAKSGLAGGIPYSFGPTLAGVTLADADTGNITITKHTTYPGGSPDPGEVGITWWINSSLTTGFPLTLNLCYTDDNVEELNESALHAFRWDGTQWTTPISTGLTVFENDNCVQMTGIQGFSAWTLKDTSVGTAKPTAAGLRAVTSQTGAWTLGGSMILILGTAGFLRRKHRA